MFGQCRFSNATLSANVSVYLVLQHRVPTVLCWFNFFRNRRRLPILPCNVTKTKDSVKRVIPRRRQQRRRHLANIDEKLFSETFSRWRHRMLLSLYGSKNHSSIHYRYCNRNLKWLPFRQMFKVGSTPKSDGSILSLAVDSNATGLFTEYRQTDRQTDYMTCAFGRRQFDILVTNAGVKCVWCLVRLCHIKDTQCTCGVFVYRVML